MTAMEEVAALLIGGVAGSMAGALLVRAGVEPEHAAAAVAIGGAGVALAGSGATRVGAAGAAAAGVGQLALAFLQREEELRQRNAGPIEEAPRKRVRLAFRPSIGRMFERAREQIDMEDEAAAMARDFDSADVGELGSDDAGEVEAMPAGSG